MGDTENTSTPNSTPIHQNGKERPVKVIETSFSKQKSVLVHSSSNSGPHQNGIVAPVKPSDAHFDNGVLPPEIDNDGNKSTEHATEATSSSNGVIERGTDEAAAHSDKSREGEIDQSCSLFVGDINKGVTENQVQELFQQYGTVVKVDIKKDRQTGNNLGYGFVTMSNIEETMACKQALHNAFVFDKHIRIGWAQQNTNLFVGDLGGAVDDELLRSSFRVFGPIYESDTFVKHGNYGFVRFKNRSDAETAKREMNGRELVPGSGKCIRIGWGDSNTQKHTVHFKFDLKFLPYLTTSFVREIFSEYGEVETVTLPSSPGVVKPTLGSSEGVSNETSEYVSNETTANVANETTANVANETTANVANRTTENISDEIEKVAKVRIGANDSKHTESTPTNADGSTPENVDCGHDPHINSIENETGFIAPTAKAPTSEIIEKKAEHARHNKGFGFVHYFDTRQGEVSAAKAIDEVNGKMLEHGIQLYCSFGKRKPHAGQSTNSGDETNHRGKVAPFEPEISSHRNGAKQSRSNRGGAKNSDRRNGNAFKNTKSSSKRRGVGGTRDHRNSKPESHHLKRVGKHSYQSQRNTQTRGYDPNKYPVPQHPAAVELYQARANANPYLISNMYHYPQNLRSTSYPYVYGEWYYPSVEYMPQHHGSAGTNTYPTPEASHSASALTSSVDNKKSAEGRRFSPTATVHYQHPYEASHPQNLAQAGGVDTT